MLYVAVVTAVAVAGMIILAMRLKNKGGSQRKQNFNHMGDNVIPFRRKGSVHKFAVQKCSFCGKEESLTFYGGDNGVVKGVCKHCKPKAERRDMLPL